MPIWITKQNTGPSWFYGQVVLSTVSAFQVILLSLGLFAPSFLPHQMVRPGEYSYYICLQPSCVIQMFTFIEIKTF